LKSMDIALMGGLFPRHLEHEIIENSKGRIDFAANNLQWALVDGLDACNKLPVHLCNVLVIGTYPFGYNKLIIKTEKFSHQTGSFDANYGFVNLIGLSRITRFLAGTKGLIRWAKKKSEQKVVVCYSIHTPFLLASVIAKLLFPEIKLCLVIPDLPELVSDSKNIIYRSLKLIDKGIINFCIARVDTFVLLSDFMTEKIKIRNQPFIRVEGIFNSRRYDFLPVEKSHKTIMYSGNLDVKQGILELLNSFSKIGDKEFKLWIAGYGNGLPAILKAMGADDRIIYWPKLKQNELFRLQKMASLLIHPIKPDHIKTRYFFPSKIMEYMASGTPTLMYKLSCLPEEYYKYLYFFDNGSNEAMGTRIVEICNKPLRELSDFGITAQNFILNEKNPEVQCGKIYAMLQKLY
jgi:glycosyltransferase involved in cell wall biosynthesis